MKVKNLIITKEDAEIFENAVAFKEFFATLMLNKPTSVDIEAWKNSLKETERFLAEKCDYIDEFNLILNDYDLFAMYDKTCVAIEIFKVRGRFSKKFKKIFERTILGWYCYNAVKSHLSEVSYKTFHKIMLARLAPVPSKVSHEKQTETQTEKQTERQRPEFYRYIEATKVVFKEKRKLILTLSSILALVWILFFLNHLIH